MADIVLVHEAGIVLIAVVVCKEYIDRLMIDSVQWSKQTESDKLAAHIERQIADAEHNDAGAHFDGFAVGCRLVD